jgi:hypothetical protein
LSFITISHAIIALFEFCFLCVCVVSFVSFSRYFAKSMELAHPLPRNGMRKVYARLKT